MVGQGGLAALALEGILGALCRRSRHGFLGRAGSSEGAGSPAQACGTLRSDPAPREDATGPIPAFEREWERTEGRELRLPGLHALLGHFPEGPSSPEAEDRKGALQSRIEHAQSMDEARAPCTNWQTNEGTWPEAGWALQLLRHTGQLS